MKKILSLILAVAMLTAACISANAAEISSENTQAVNTAEYSELTTYTSSDYEYDVQHGSVIITKYTGNKKIVEIPAEIDGKPVKEIGFYAFGECTNVEEIVIPNPVDTIEKLAFWGCTSLKTVELPASLSTISTCAFLLCTSLENFNIDTDNPNFQTIDGVLYTKGKDFVLMKFPTGRSGYYTFPDGITGVREYAFANCYELKKIALPNGVTEIEPGAFNSVNEGGLTITGKEDFEMTGYVQSNVAVYAHYDSYTADSIAPLMGVAFHPLELGDVNLDGRITAVDALLVQRAALGLEQLSDNQARTGYIKYDALTTSNAMEILRYSIGLHSSLDSKFYPEEVPY